MNCAQVQELLSAYLDNELPDQSRQHVAQHLKTCSACSAELAGFENLSAMANRLPAPPVPRSDWNQLAKSLDDEAALPRIRDKRPWPLSTGRFLALAATVLLAAGIGWIGHRILAPDHQHARVFGHYLEEFQRDPAQAQTMLLAKYKGQALDANDAIRRVGYRPAVADGMPEGYSIDSTYVMKMPCCTCVQTLCKRGDGSVLVVFEHDDKEPNWFSGLPGIKAFCGNRQCCLIGLDRQLAASWKRGNRHLTIVGAKDIGEVNTIVSWLDENGDSTG